jgi:hypothetical protein
MGIGFHPQTAGHAQHTGVSARDARQKSVRAVVVVVVVVVVAVVADHRSAGEGLLSVRLELDLELET